MKQPTKLEECKTPDEVIGWIWQAGCICKDDSLPEGVPPPCEFCRVNPRVEQALTAVRADRDELLKWLRRFVRAVDSGAFLGDIHWLAADARILDRTTRV